MLVQQCIDRLWWRRSRCNSGNEPRPVSPWKVMLGMLDNLRNDLASNFVPPFLQQKLFMQLFSFINVQLFNRLLEHRECCSFQNGVYIKNGLTRVCFLHSLAFFWLPGLFDWVLLPANNE